MIGRNLIEQLGKPWFIDQSYAMNYMPMIKAYLETGKLPKEEGVDYAELRASVQMFSYNPESKVSSKFSDTTSNSIAVIPIKGVLMKEDGLCNKGTATIAREVQAANNSEFIKSILFKVDSGGGTVDGTETLANAIKASSKPVIAFIDGVAGSAAYWSITHSNEIILSGQTAKVGSIGTMIDLSGLDPDFKVNVIRATKSTDKNEDFLQALDGNVEPFQKNHLDKLNKVFLSSVADGRKDSIKDQDDVFTGKMFYGKDAIKVGLADRIGTFEQALERANELGKETKTIKTKSNNMGMKENLKGIQASISSMLDGLSPEAKTEGAKDIDLIEVNAKIEALQTEMNSALVNAEAFDALQENFNALKAEKEILTSANSDLTLANTTLETLKETNATEIQDLKESNLKLSGKGEGTTTPNAVDKNEKIDDTPLTQDEIIAKSMQTLQNLKQK